MELSTYALELLRENAELLLYRGRRDIEPSIFSLSRLCRNILRKQSSGGLSMNCSLRARLDPAWAIVPSALVQEKGQTMLVLEDPGGQPLDMLLEGPLDLTAFLRISKLRTGHANHYRRCGDLLN